MGGEEKATLSMEHIMEIKETLGEHQGRLKGIDNKLKEHDEKLDGHDDYIKKHIAFLAEVATSVKNIENAHALTPVKVTLLLGILSTVMGAEAWLLTMIFKAMFKIQ